MIRIRVEAKELTPEIRAVLAEGVQLGLERIALHGTAMVKEKISTPYEGKPPAVATGTLANAVFPQIEPGRQVTIAAGPPADVYAPFVETGTRPHFPPPRALLVWVYQKFRPKNEGEALSIAYAVARKIAKHGTRGHFMFARSEQDLEELVPGIFTKTIAEAARNRAGVLNG